MAAVCQSVSREVARDPSFHAQDLLVLAFLQCVPFSGFNIYIYYIPSTYTRVLLASRIPSLQLG